MLQIKKKCLSEREKNVANCRIKQRNCRAKFNLPGKDHGPENVAIAIGWIRSSDRTKSHCGKITAQISHVKRTETRTTDTHIYNL